MRHGAERPLAETPSHRYPVSMNTPRCAVPAFLLLALVASTACESLPKDIGGLVGGSSAAGLDEGTIAAGLREALKVGSERAVGSTSQVNGFLSNKLIRIAMPDDLEKMASTLRKVGFSKQVDELEVSMNRAAEQASGEAITIFWDAVQGLTIEDARRVLQGGKRSATNLLRERTTTQLSSRFKPIVTQKMDEVGLSRLYNDLAGKYNALPLGQKPAIRLEDYVTQQALDGVFTMLGKEEERIRADPLARTTELLQRVFK